MEVLILTSALLLIFGFYTLIRKKNLIKSLIGIILMIESSHLLFIASAPLNTLAQYFVLISIVISGCLIGVMIAFILTVYRRKGTLNTRVLEVV
jgi:NADH:ubiquinone oxidoreductase subunit K